MSERKQGTVVWFNTAKGYGFIAPDDGSEDIFVHYSEIQAEGFANLDEGDKVEFGVEDTEKGPQAVQVTRVV